MLALLRHVWNRWWKATESDFKWHLATEIKRYFFDRWGVSNVLNAIASGYAAFRAWADSKPDYVIALVFLVAFACIGIIHSFVRELLSRIEWLKETELRNLKQQHEKLFPLILSGESLWKQYKNKKKEPNFKLDKASRQWEEEVLYFLDHFSDADHVERFLNTSDVMPRPTLAEEIAEEDKDTYLLLRSRVTRLRQFYEEVERKSPPGTFDVKHFSPFQSV